MEGTVNTSEKTRYSDEELAEFKALIQERLAQARKDLELLQENVANSESDDTAPTFKILEEGAAVLSKEENSALAVRQIKYIKNLENALIRIENKTYGICRVTGKLIPKERLRAVPHATLSVEAKMQQNKRK
jgi:RNA polymerase-binding transcription factor DksA